MYTTNPSFSSLDSTNRTSDRDQNNEIPHPCGCWEFINKETGEKVKFYCKQWKCPRCGKTKQKKLINDVKQAAQDYKLFRFVTITLPAELRSEDFTTQNKYIKDSWSKLRKRLARKYKGFRYIWILERHKDGTPHMHILVSHYIPQRTLSDICAEVGLGKIVDIRRVKDNKIASYIAKYVAKDVSVLPKAVRRFNFSKGIRIVLKLVSTGKWLLMELSCGHGAAGMGWGGHKETAIQGVKWRSLLLPG